MHYDTYDTNVRSATGVSLFFPLPSPFIFHLFQECVRAHTHGEQQKDQTERHTHHASERIEVLIVVE